MTGAESTTRPSRTSHARLREIETQAPSVSPQGRPAVEVAAGVAVAVVRCAGSVVTCEVATAGVAVLAAPLDTAAGTMVAGAAAVTGAAGAGWSAVAPGSPRPAVMPSAPTSATAEPAIVVLVRMSAPGPRRGPGRRAAHVREIASMGRPRYPTTPKG